MTMQMHAKIYDAITKKSAKGNEYTVLRLKQTDSFDYFDVMLDSNIGEDFAAYEVGDSVTVLLEYKTKYKSFKVVAFL